MELPERKPGDSRKFYPNTYHRSQDATLENRKKEPARQPDRSARGSGKVGLSLSDMSALYMERHFYFRNRDVFRKSTLDVLLS